MKSNRPRRLTAFQSLMRGWAELAPYNFIHALRFEEPAEQERWRDATAETLHLLGLEASALAIERPTVEIDVHLEAELNRGFAAADLPLRFFLIETEDGGHWFGVVLDHFLADDFSARALLRGIYARYRGTDLPEHMARAGKQPPSCGWFTEWRSFWQQARALRRAGRRPLRNPLDLTVGLFHSELPLGTLEAVRVLAKQQNATVHDVFLAATAQACGAAQTGPAGARRDSVGLATAMDLRRFSDGADRASFGLLITQYAVVEPHPEKIPLPELIARIAQQTRTLKAMSGRAAFIAGLGFWRLARSRRAKATLFQRGAPFAAGVSNVNLSGSWIEQSGVAEFRRVGPTGPVVPILLMITTFHGRLFLDTTYRTTAFTRPEAEQLVADFARGLAGEICS
ncbi:MAG: hypothetical protein ABIR71_12015 [Chthoniobacterales bacterium]